MCRGGATNGCSGIAMGWPTGLGPEPPWPLLRSIVDPAMETTRPSPSNGSCPVVPPIGSLPGGRG